MRTIASKVVFFVIGGALFIDGVQISKKIGLKPTVKLIIMGLSRVRCLN
jgi:hypothetical protein